MNVKTMKDDTKKSKSGLLKSIELLRDLLDEQRMAIIYLRFDVECCRREKATMQKEIDRLKGSK